MNATPNYHDAEIGGLSYSRADKSVLLALEDVCGHEVHLFFSGVQAFRVSDFGLQNVVSRVLASPTHGFAREEIREYIQWARSQHDYQASVTDSSVAEINDKLSRGELILYVFEPSVGAEIVILAEHIEVSAPSV